METPLSVLLVEDDPDTCRDFSYCFSQREDACLVGVTASSTHALQLTQELQPDAVVLALELLGGNGNGLLYLDGLAALDIPCRPFILITTNNSSAITYEHARRNGADFIFFKQQSDYSPHMVVDFLCMMKETIQERSNIIGNTGESSPQQLNNRICRELDTVGINPKSIGYRYLVDGIRLVTQRTVSNLCGEIAAQYDKTAASVMRAMQNAINRSWRTNNVEELARYYTAHIRPERGVPTVTEFVYFYANKLKEGL